MILKLDRSKCCTYEGTCSHSHPGDNNASQSCCTSGHCGCATSCSSCVDVCPTGAIRNEGGIVIDQDLCDECGACIEACENGALSLVQAR